MRSRSNNISIVLCVIMLTLVAFSYTYASAGIGKRAPNFKLKSINGKMMSLSQIRTNPQKRGENKVVIVDFWATWCPPCREAVPHLQKLYAKYGKRGLAVVGISLDDDSDAVKSFTKEQKLTYTMLSDTEGTAARLYGVRPIPTMFIIDKKGMVANVYVGFSSANIEKMEDEIISLLKQ